MSTYDGYDVRQMLDVINQLCRVVKLEKVEADDGAGGLMAINWRLYCLSDHFGEFESEHHSLFHLVYLAFKPHKPFADQQREQLREVGKELFSKVDSVLGRNGGDTAEDHY
jgi:hypothetical protein